MPESAKPLVTALVVSRNSRDELLQSLKTFFASADVPVEAVVVDNDSSDGSPAVVTEEFPQATVLVQSKDLGYGRAANIGLERCQGRFVLLLSPDVRLDPQASARACCCRAASPTRKHGALFRSRARFSTRPSASARSFQRAHASGAPTWDTSRTRMCMRWTRAPRPA